VKTRFAIAYILIGVLAFAWTLGIGYAVGQLRHTARKSDLGNANIRAIAEKSAAQAAQQQGLAVLGEQVTRVARHGDTVDVYLTLKTDAGTFNLDVTLDKGLYTTSNIRVAK